MAITGWRGISDLCLALSVDAPPRATVMNLTITARDTSLERGTRTTEGQMPVFMKYDGVDGQFNGADAYDFSQLTSEPRLRRAKSTTANSQSLNGWTRPPRQWITFLGSKCRN